MYPAERIDFDPGNVPDAVLAALEEAVACHANRCYVAASMMVRKSLEVVCEDRAATGDNLFQRIEALARNVVLPQGYIDGLHNLRLLGNDAAHVESRDYNQVGADEVEAGIEVIKDLLRAIY